MSFQQKEAKEVSLETLNKTEEDEKTWTMNEFGWDSQTCRISSAANGTTTTGRTSGATCSADANLERAIPFLKHSSSSEETTPITTTSLPSNKSSSRPGYCQADGCGKNLANLTYYHVRNKICDVHIKADVFTRDGCQLRFCQRCGNAHNLTEFDGKKHSCRAQLEKHNARRRKRQNEAAAADVAGAAGASKSKHKKKSQALPSTVGVQPPPHDGEEGQLLYDQPVQQRSSRKRMPLVRADFVQDDDEMDVVEEQQQQQQQQQQRRTSANEANPKNRAASPELHFSTEDNQNQNQESDALLEDLSSWLTDHLVDIKNFDGNDGGGGDDDVLNLLPLTSAEDGDSFDFAISLMHPDLQTQPSSSTIDPLLIPSSLSATLTTTTTAAAAVGPTLTESAKLSTISIKLFGCTPDELPQDLRSQLVSWFDGQVASLEGYMRPGCVHLTVQATTLTGAKRNEPESGGQQLLLQGSVGNSVERLVHTMLSSGDDLWRSKTLLVQTGTEVALVHGGKIQKSWEINGGSSSSSSNDDEFIGPSVIGMQPLVLLSSSLAPGSATKLVVQGVNLLQDDCEIVCRLQGQYVAVERAGCTDCKCVVAVKACCQGPSVADEFVAKAEGWQSRCCGCCIGKLATLSINDDDEEKPSSSSCCGGGRKNKSKSNTAQVDQVAPQLVSLQLSGALRPGLLHIDVLKRAFMAPIGGRVLVVDSAAVQGELMAVAARSPETAASWVNALSIVYEYIGNPSKVSYSTVVEKITAKLLHDAVGAGLIEVAKRLHSLLNDEIMEVASSLPLPRSSSTKGDAAGEGGLDGLALLSHIDQACRAATLLRASKFGCTDALSLLHRAVLSQNPAAVDLVLMWGQEANYHWRCDGGGPRGLTPLHFAALVGDYSASSRMILAMVTACEPGTDAWRGAKTADEQHGLTPADFAARLKRTNLLDAFGESFSSSSSPQKGGIATLVIPSKGKHSVDQEEGEEVAPATPRRCKCVGNCPCAMAAEPCASCCSTASSDDEACCGGENGTCACCAGAAAVVVVVVEEEKEKEEKGFQGGENPPVQKRSCCH